MAVHARKINRRSPRNIFNLSDILEQIILESSVGTFYRCSDTVRRIGRAFYSILNLVDDVTELGVALFSLALSRGWIIKVPSLRGSSTFREAEERTLKTLKHTINVISRLINARISTSENRLSDLLYFPKASELS